MIALGRRGETPGADIVGISAQGAHPFGSKVGVPANKLGQDPIFDAEHVVEHENLTVAARTGADADRGHIDGGLRVMIHYSDFIIEGIIIL